MSSPRARSAGFRGHQMKKVESGGPVRAVAFSQAVAGLPDTILLN